MYFFWMFFVLLPSLMWLDGIPIINIIYIEITIVIAGFIMVELWRGV